MRPILEICEQFTVQVERWGGDVLPALLFEGSLAAGGDDKVGAMVQERFQIVTDINQVIWFYIRHSITVHTFSRTYTPSLSHSTNSCQ